MAFLQQEIPPREKEQTGVAPPAMPARSTAGDQRVSPGEQVPRQPRRAGERSRQRALHLGGAVLYGQPCRETWSTAMGCERLWKDKGEHWDGDGTQLHST